MGGRPQRLAAAAVAVMTIATLKAQVLFVDVAGSAAIGPYRMAQGMAGGVAAADFDGDGDIDIFAPNGYTGTPDQLYRNLGGGVFEEIAAQAGVASIASNRAALFLDYDGDGDLDLLVAGDCWHAICTEATTLRLYEQAGPAQFSDVTVQAGLFRDLINGDSPHVGGLCAGDVDGDGWLDLCVTFWDGGAHLFRNNGNGTFADVSPTSGTMGLRSHWQPVMHDFNGDGRQDIFIAVDFAPNLLFINQGNLTFVNVAAAANVASAWNEMGVAISDPDDDGDMDLYVTNISRLGRHNLLLRNDSAAGVPRFTEVARQAGVDQGYWGWGATFLDCDNDGLLDLATTNGFEDPFWIFDPSRLFRNLGGPSLLFAEISAISGFADANYGTCLLALDMDRDGDLDVLQSCALDQGMRLLENRRTGAAAANGYLTVRPRMNGPNTHAIGAVVRATAGARTMSRLITCGTSMMGQEPAEAHFGLGAATTVDQVTVEWPDGTRTIVDGVIANQVLTITGGGCPANWDGRGAVDIFDLLAFLNDWFAATPASDFNRDGIRADVFDLLAFLGAWFAASSGPCP